MGAQTRNQEYTYQYKNVTITNQQFCGYGPNLQINLPDNVLAIKGLFIRVVAQFDPAESSKTISEFILNGVPAFTFQYKGTTSTVPVNWQANASNILDARLDLQGQLSKLHIFPGAAGNQPYIIMGMGLNGTTTYSSTTNQILLWKIDLTYTTQGIR